MVQFRRKNPNICDQEKRTFKLDTPGPFTSGVSRCSKALIRKTVLYLHVMWSHTVVCGPVADNVVSVVKIVVLTPLLFEINLVSILACL